MSEQQQLLLLGQMYPNPLPVSEGAIAELLRPNSNRLFIALPKLTSDEIDTIQDAPITAALHHDKHSDGLIIVFQFNSKGIKLTFDCPFDASVISDIEMHHFTDGNSRLAIQVVAVDSNNKRIVALRYITMSPELSIELCSIAQNQLSTQYNKTEARKWIDSQQAKYSPDQLSELSIKQHLLGQP